MPLKEGEKLLSESPIQVNKGEGHVQTVIVRKIENAPVTRMYLGRGDSFVDLSTPMKPSSPFRFEVEPVNE